MDNFDEISPDGFSLGIWHAANNGHKNILKHLLNKETNLQIIDKEAPDGTTPLTMAIVKGHHEVLKCFEETHGRDRIIAESAKFGKIYKIDNYKMKALQDEAMANAVFSGNKEVIKYIQSVTNDISFPKEVNDHVLDKEILHLFGGQNVQKHSVLVQFSKEFPLFNDDIEGNTSNSLKIELPQDSYKTKWPRISYKIKLPQICCMDVCKKTKKTKKTIYVQDIKVDNACDK